MIAKTFPEERRFVFLYYMYGLLNGENTMYKVKPLFCIILRSTENQNITRIFIKKKTDLIQFIVDIPQYQRVSAYRCGYICQYSTRLWRDSTPYFSFFVSYLRQKRHISRHIVISSEGFCRFYTNLCFNDFYHCWDYEEFKVNGCTFKSQLLIIYCITNNNNKLQRRKTDVTYSSFFGRCSPCKVGSDLKRKNFHL